MCFNDMVSPLKSLTSTRLLIACRSYVVIGHFSSNGADRVILQHVQHSLIRHTVISRE